MTDVNQFHDQIFDEFKPSKKMPDMINVLTILTFIGSGWGFISAIIAYVNSCGNMVKMSANQGSFQGKGILAKIMQNSADMLTLSCEFKVPLLIIGLLCSSACIVGAILMRKLNVKGYYLYLIGTICIPIAAVLIFGFNLLTGAGFFFPILFIILYSTQLKHLK